VLDRGRAHLEHFISRRLPGGRYTGATLQLGGSTAVAQGIVILSAPILTRVYSPAEMGQFGILLAFVGFAAVLVNLRYDMAIVSAPSDTEAARLLAISGIVVVPMSLAAAGLLLVFIRWRVLSFGALSMWSAAPALILLIGAGVLTAVRSWAVRHSEFAAIGRSSLAQGVGRAIVPVAAGLLGAGWSGLVLGEIAGRVFGVRRLLLLALRSTRVLAASMSRTMLVQTARASWRYPLVAAPSTMLDALGGALVLPLLAMSFGQEAAGELLIAQRVAAVPAALIGASVADVFHARVTKVFNESPHAVRGLVLRTARALLVVGVAIYVPLGIASFWLFDDVFGARWQHAGALIALFTPLNILTLLVSPVTRLYFVTNRQELKLLFDVLIIAAPLISFWFMVSLGAKYWTCMVTFMLLSVAAYLVQLVVTVWMAGLPAREHAITDGTLEPY
jgi:lipopolysaccharide exporter